MLGRTCLWPLRRFASVDPGRDGWNLYAYVGNNPIKFVDPTGLEVSLASLSADQQQAIIEGLAQFTGNSYEVESGLLQLQSIGDNSSTIATEFINSAIKDPRTFSVESTDRGSHAKDEKLFINTESFSDVDYGEVDKNTFNLGSTFIHELRHSVTGEKDFPGGVRIMNSTDHKGPVVEFVNTIRVERGLPTRERYGAEVGRRGYLKFRFRVPGKRRIKIVRRKKN